MQTQRGLVDYALQRRALLAEVMSGHTGVTGVCDATPYLIRAAKFHGVPTEVSCPVCRKEPLTHVYWVYGDEIKHMAGSARQPPELEKMAASYGEFSVYQVEVAGPCWWTLLLAFLVGGLRGKRARSRPRAAK